MNASEQIKEAIKALAGKNGVVTLLAKVKAVDQDNALISVYLGDLVIEDVRLRSIVDGDNGLYIVPEVGSMVLLIRVGGSDDLMAVGFSKYEKVMVKGESVSLEVNQDNIIFNGNALGSFMADINKLVGKINALEDDLNNLKTVFTDWAPVAYDGGAALKTASASWASQSIVSTSVDDIKDEKILN
jgi:hypothetical protein